MEQPPLETYVAGIDPVAVPLVRALDSTIRSVEPGLDAAIKYGILMYGVHGDWRTWVCAIDAGPKRVGLRFPMYVAEAVQRYEDYKANAPRLLADSRAAAADAKAARLARQAKSTG